MLDFVAKLVDLTGLSTKYAESAWYTLKDSDRGNPQKAAKDYAKRYKLNKKSLD